MLSPGEPKVEQRPAQSLYEQRNLLLVTLSSMGDAVITTDSEARVTFLNPTAEALTGWAQKDAVGQPLGAVFAIINEETRHAAENPATRALREGLVVGLASHTLLIARDGTERPIDDSAAPMRNARGLISGCVLVFRDIAERRRAERRIQDALTYAEDIIATVREPLIVLDAALRVRSANRSFYDFFRAAKETTVGRLVYDLGNGQWNMPRLRELLEDVLPRNHAFDNFEIERDFPAIGQRSLLLNARRVQDGNGGGDGLILLAIEDITDRKRAQARLLESEVRYRRLFETARDAILILDGDTGRIIDANSFVAGLTGYPVDSFLGKELWQIGLFKDQQENRRLSQELKEKEYVRYDHLPLRVSDGHAADVEFISNVYQMDGYRVIQCNIRDISERRRMERAIEQQTKELADLHRRKDEFLAMLSHELRNPLAAIVGALQILRLQTNENQIQRESRDIIERQAGHLALLVDDLLEVSRVIVGRIHLRKERVSLNAIVEQAVETVLPLVKQYQHEVEVTLPPESLWLDADHARLEQVVVNLLTNAAKYTDAGGRIWLTAQQVGDEAELRVRDTGVGIDPEFLPHVFDLFTQANRSLARSQGGLGIGLSLVHALVKLHGGTVEAHSAGLGQGSEFVVHLPVTHLPAAPAAPHPTDMARPAGQPLRVLVVDDLSDLRTTSTMLLSLFGYEVRAAHDGPSALEAGRAFRPDAVLLDIGLPGMDGYELARRMRQDPALQNAVLIAITGYGLESDRQRSQEAGFDHHLVKPVDFSTTVRKLLATVAEGRGKKGGAQ